MASEKSPVLDLALIDIEAFADNENGGNGGIAVSDCRMSIYERVGSGIYYIKCDPNTTSSIIYKCPSPIEGDSYVGTCDKCVK